MPFIISSWVSLERGLVKIARPSLVFGQGGASTEMFLKMAKLPILFLPNGGNFDITVPKNLPKSTQEQI